MGGSSTVWGVTAAFSDEEQERDQALQAGADDGGTKSAGEWAEQKGDSEGDLKHAGAGVRDAESGARKQQIDGQREEDGDPEKALRVCIGW